MKYAKKAGYVLALALFLILTAGPFLWTFLLSVTPDHAIFSQGSGFWPGELIWDNYIELFSGGQRGSRFFASLLNSLKATGVTLCIGIPAALLSAYALGRMEFKGRMLIRDLLLVTMVIPVMATIIPVLVGYLMGDVAQATIKDANPAMFIAMGIFALVFIVLMFVNIPEPDAATEGEKLSYRTLFKFRHYVLGIIAIFIYVGVEVGIPNIMNLFLTHQDVGMEAAAAGAIVGTYWFLMLVGRFVGGAIGGKVSSKTMLAVTSLCGLVFVAVAIFASPTTTVNMPVFKSDISFGLTEAPINVLFLVLCGLCTSVMWGSIFNLAVEGIGKYVTLGSGFFMVMVCGGGILPTIQGAIADASTYMTSYWIIFAGLAYLLYYAAIGCKNVNKDIKVD